MKKCTLIIFCLAWLVFKGYTQPKETRFIDEGTVSVQRFGNDRQWYLKNIPFFECSDPDIEKVYYYRWELYKAHIKNLGEKGFIVTEFLNAMSWDKKPYNSLIDATSFHIYEGRWLKDKRYITDYINYMYKQGGNNRNFSESIADGAYAYYLIDPDKKFIVSQLPYMVKVYNSWNDHYDASKQLYYVEPLKDATEYTISSIDASGGKDGFRGGDSFRPSINSYMYANALAIKNIALMDGNDSIAKVFDSKASRIKKELQNQLWNDSLNHFIDRFKVNNAFVKYWDYIRGRELVSYVPWAFNLPDNNNKFIAAWNHLTDTTQLMGKYGLRTNEPSYQYYMKQYRYDQPSGRKECQWNGPSWPFQTSQVLLGMANVLNNYDQNIVSVDKYLKVLKKYTQQHYIKTGELNIIEDYDPDNGGPIVNLDQRSEHYNHSEYNDLIITGLCGLRPGAGNMLQINPLVNNGPANGGIKYFCLENVLYHGHNITILYDRDGKKYHQGKGLWVYIDGKCKLAGAALGKKEIEISTPVFRTIDTTVNIAVNVAGKGFPKASASYTNGTDDVNMAIDGRIWYFGNVKNRWSCEGSNNKSDWFELEFEKAQNINKVALYFYGDGKKLAAPQNYAIEYWSGTEWLKIQNNKSLPQQPLANTQNIVNFNQQRTNKIRVNFTNAGNNRYTALTEVEVY